MLSNEHHLWRGLILCLFWAWGHHLVELTRGWDALFAASEMSRWMDTVGGMAGGWHHRIKQGHDVLANAPQILVRFGLEGFLTRYPWELLRDLSTPHGLPLPGVQTFWSWGLIPASTGTRWLSVNAAEVGMGLYAWQRRPQAGWEVGAQALGYFSSGNPLIVLAWWRHRKTKVTLI